MGKGGEGEEVCQADLPAARELALQGFGLELFQEVGPWGRAGGRGTGGSGSGSGCAASATDAAADAFLSPAPAAARCA